MRLVLGCVLYYPEIEGDLIESEIPRELVAKKLLQTLSFCDLNRDYANKKW